MAAKGGSREGLREGRRAAQREGLRYIVHVGGMSCSGCEDAVRRALLAVPGVREVTASTPKGEARVVASDEVAPGSLSDAIDASGYECLGVEAQGGGTALGAAGSVAAHGALVRRATGSFDAAYLLIIAVGAFVVAQNLGVNQLFQAIPTVSGQNIGYAALFTIGLLTSVHCIAMCGGINLAQSTALGALKGTPGMSAGRGLPEKANGGSGEGENGNAHGNAPVSAKSPRRSRVVVAESSLLYNAGRLTSYTLIGGILGLIGQAASITLGVRSAIGLAAGIVMLLAGIGMAGGFPFLARLAPRLPKRLQRAGASFARRGPYALGLVNGFMPCGPLQAMQVYAITTGSFAAGALSIFFFCLGTIPLVLAFGIVASAMNRSWRRVMLRASAVMMVIFGLFMVQNNLAIAGIQVPGLASVASGATAAAPVAATQQGDVQSVTTQLRADGYDSIQVKAGVPVKWTISAADGTLNGCNAEVVLPDFNQQVKLKPGDTTITFTPQKAGTYNFSCWMGMLHGQIIVS